MISTRTREEVARGRRAIPKFRRLRRLLGAGGDDEETDEDVDVDAERAWFFVLALATIVLLVIGGRAIIARRMRRANQGLRKLGRNRLDEAVTLGIAGQIKPAWKLIQDSLAPDVEIDLAEAKFLALVCEQLLAAQLLDEAGRTRVQALHAAFARHVSAEHEARSTSGSLTPDIRKHFIELLRTHAAQARIHLMTLVAYEGNLAVVDATTPMPEWTTLQAAAKASLTRGDFVHPHEL